MSLQAKKIGKIFNGKFWLMAPFFVIAILLIIVPAIIVIVYAFVPHYHLGEAANWKIINYTFGQILGWTILTSLATTLICIVIGFPFAYLLAQYKGKIFHAFALLVVTAPIWSSTLFKLIGLRTMFDIINGAVNSTYGDQYTLLGYVYLFLPLMILPLHQVLEGMPNNYALASKDLGASRTRTFFKVVLPYCKNALLSGITLVFIPSMMIISVTAYMNNASNSQLLGGLVYSQGTLGLDNKLSLSRASVISIVTAFVLLVLYFAVVKFPKWVRYWYRLYKNNKANNDYYKYYNNVQTKKERKHEINEKLGRNLINFDFLLTNKKGQDIDWNKIQSIIICDQIKQQQMPKNRVSLSNLESADFSDITKNQLEDGGVLIKE